MNLHWLPIKQRIQYKIALMTYKSIQGMGPDYFCDMIRPYSAGRPGLRSDEKEEIRKPDEIPNLIYYGTRSFLHAAPDKWNNLVPIATRKATSLTIFKKELKTFLLKKAYFKKQL